MKLQIVVDFAETLVKERPMIEWVLLELRNKENLLWWRLCFMISSFASGFMSIVFGRFQATGEWAARVAYMNFRGISEKSLERLINHRRENSTYILNLNPELISILSTIKRKRDADPSQSLGISIHSQGTCARAIELFTQRQDVAKSLRWKGLHVSSIVANHLEVVDGKFTGRLEGQIITKHSKPRGIPKGSIFIGDSHDEKAVSKLKEREFEFINCDKGRDDEGKRFS